MVGPRARLASLALLALSCASEAPRATEVVLIVTSDLAVPEGLDGVRVEAVGPDGALRTAHATLRAPSDLPVSVRLARRRDSGVALHVDVFGERAGADVLVRSAELAFVPGERRLLALPLLARCVDVLCADGLSCGESGCADVEVEADALPPYDTATFEALGEAPEGAGEIPPAVESSDAEDASEPEPPEQPEDAGAPELDDASARAPDAASDAGDAPDAGPPPGDSGSEGDAGSDAGCPQVLVCRGLCVPLPLPGLCSCAMECAPPR